jgi:protein-tyrosine phosphatase
MQAHSKTAILFVCMGNICRSPTAEGVFRHKVQEAGMEQNFLIDSAGTHAYHVGEQPDPRSQLFAHKRGIDLSTQRARRVQPSDFAQFDLLIAMDKSNLQNLQRICPPQYKDKLKLMMSYASHSPADEVPDPYYDSGRGFDTVLDYIEDAAEGLLHVLRGT